MCVAYPASFISWGSSFSSRGTQYGWQGQMIWCCMPVWIWGEPNRDKHVVRKQDCDENATTVKRGSSSVCGDGDANWRLEQKEKRCSRFHQLRFYFLPGKFFWTWKSEPTQSPAGVCSSSGGSEELHTDCDDIQLLYHDTEKDDIIMARLQQMLSPGLKSLRSTCSPTLNQK